MKTRLQIVSAGAYGALFAGLSTSSFAALWDGTSSIAWNDASNWVGDAGTGGSHAVIDTSVGNVATISENIIATPFDIIVGSTSGTNGLLNHIAGTAQTGAGYSMYIGTNGGVGRYNLANTNLAGGGITGFGQGSGSLGVAGKLYIGGFNATGANGTMNVNTIGTVTVGNQLQVGAGGSTGVLNLQSGAITTAGGSVEFGNGAGSSGSLGMSGGSITKNGADNWIFASNGGTAVGNHIGGVITVNNQFWVANNTGSTGTYNMGGTAETNVANIFAIGRDGGNGSMTMTGGTLNKTGFGNFVVGYKTTGTFTTTGQFTQSGGTVNVNNEFWVGQGAGSTGTYSLSGAGALNVAGWISIGREGGSGTANISGGTLTKTGSGYFIVGDNSSGTLTQTGGTVSTTTELWVGQAAGATNAVYNLSGGNLSASNWIAVGRAGGTGTLNMTGGTITKTGVGGFVIGGDGKGTVNVSAGLIDIQSGNLYVGTLGNQASVLNMSGTAEVRVAKMMVGVSGTVTGTANLDGGTLRVGQIGSGMYADGRSPDPDASGTTTAIVHFNGTQIVATGSTIEFISRLDQANLKAGGLKIDSNGHDISSTQVFSGTGGLTKSGAGTLTFYQSSSYTGKTTIQAGTLALAHLGGIGASSTIEVRGGAVLDVSEVVEGWTLGAGQILAGQGTITAGFEGMTLAGQIHPGSSAGTLTFIGSTTMTGLLNAEVTGGGNTADLMDVNGRLTLSGATLSITNLGTFAIGDKFTLIAYDELVGTFANFASDDTVYLMGGQFWRINYNDTLPGLNGGGDLQTPGAGYGYVTLTAVPEPAAMILGSLGMLALLRRRKSP